MNCPAASCGGINPQRLKQPVPFFSPYTKNVNGSEQLTYLLFLKMADERTKAPYGEPSPVPAEYSWSTLIRKDGDELFDHYRHVLERLGNEKGLLGLIFNKARINRDKASLDIFWLRDESLEESDNLPDPDVLAQEIVEDLEAALEQFREIANDLGGEGTKETT